MPIASDGRMMNMHDVLSTASVVTLILGVLFLAAAAVMFFKFRIWEVIADLRAGKNESSAENQRAEYSASGNIRMTAPENSNAAPACFGEELPSERTVRLGDAEAFFGERTVQLNASSGQHAEPTVELNSKTEQNKAGTASEFRIITDIVMIHTAEGISLQ